MIGEIFERILGSHPELLALDLPSAVDRFLMIFYVVENERAGPFGPWDPEVWRQMFEPTVRKFLRRKRRAKRMSGEGAR